MGKMTKPTKASIVALLHDLLPIVMVRDPDLGLLARIGTVLLAQNHKLYKDDLMQITAVLSSSISETDNEDLKKSPLLPTLNDNRLVAGE